MNVGSDSKILHTKELILSRNPEIPFVKTLDHGNPLVTVFRGIWTRDQSNIRLHDLCSATAAEGRERICTKIIKYSTVV